MSIQQRKKDHVDLCVTGDVGYEMPTGFDAFYFRHNALPEVNLNDVSVDASLLGRSFSFPLMISSMTGGYSDAGRITHKLQAFVKLRTCLLAWGVSVHCLIIRGGQKFFRCT